MGPKCYNLGIGSKHYSAGWTARVPPGFLVSWRLLTLLVWLLGNGLPQSYPQLIHRCCSNATQRKILVDTRVFGLASPAPNSSATSGPNPRDLPFLYAEGILLIILDHEPLEPLDNWQGNLIDISSIHDLD